MAAGFACANVINCVEAETLLRGGAPSSVALSLSAMGWCGCAVLSDIEGAYEGGGGSWFRFET